MSQETSELKRVFGRPHSLSDVRMHYCPGCTHGVAHRLVAEAMDELDIEGKAIGVCPVGCSVFGYEYWECDMLEAAHGRAPAVATGLKRVLPDRIVWTYQGDGDMASIGMGELVHAAARGENICIFFINNGVYGMTQGQMAPTTLLGQKTSTTPAGRTVETNGFPIDICRLLNALDGPGYLARVALSNPKTILQAKKAVKKAFQCQLAEKGFALVEMLSTCSTYWGLEPVKAMQRIDEELVPKFPLGEYRTFEGEAK